MAKTRYRRDDRSEPFIGAGDTSVMTQWKIIEGGLGGVILPPLIRPPNGPDDYPTEGVVCWGAMMYAYSSIAHVRKILAGLVTLADAGNTPTADVICRHVFEWAAHACYVERTLREDFANSNWKDAFELLSQVDGGNLWLRNHGHKYDALPLQREAPKPLRIGMLVEAYEQYQADKYGEGDAKDAYGFLSEHSHPNWACFLQYRDLSGDEVRFIEPPPSAPRAVNRPLLEWLVFVHGILGLARENIVRTEVLAVLTKTVLPGQAEPGKAI
jgi:hypothetical protein